MALKHYFYSDDIVNINAINNNANNFVSQCALVSSCIEEGGWSCLGGALEFQTKGRKGGKKNMVELGCGMKHES